MQYEWNWRRYGSGDNTCYSLVSSWEIQNSLIDAKLPILNPFAAPTEVGDKCFIFHVHKVPNLYLINFIPQIATH